VIFVLDTMEKESKRKTRKNYPLKSKHQPQEWKGEGRITSQYLILLDSVYIIIGKQLI
jgi:hypothetical protein